MADRVSARSALYTNAIMEYADGCDLVLDLGCGWGHQMIDLHLAGLGAQFFGGDRSEHSRNLTDTVTALFPGMRTSWFKFDFLQPDFSAIPANHRRVCVYSCYAIEQVERIGNLLFDRILTHFAGAKITGVHLETLASQIDPSLERERQYALNRRYNVDLYPVLNGRSDLKVVAQDAVVFDFGNDNPTSLLVWKSI